MRKLQPKDIPSPGTYRMNVLQVSRPDVDGFSRLARTMLPSGHVVSGSVPSDTLEGDVIEAKLTVIRVAESDGLEVDADFRDDNIIVSYLFDDVSILQRGKAYDRKAKFIRT